MATWGEIITLAGMILAAIFFSISFFYSTTRGKGSVYLQESYLKYLKFMSYALVILAATCLLAVILIGHEMSRTYIKALDLSAFIFFVWSVFFHLSYKSTEEKRKEKEGRTNF